MKKMLLLMLLIATAPVMAINLVSQGEFNDELAYYSPYGDGQIPGWGSWVHARWETDGYLSIGWADSVGIWQTIDAPVAANAVYTLSAVVQTRPDSGGQVEGCRLEIQDADAGYAVIASQDFWFDELGDTYGSQGEWRTVSLTFDTSDYPAIVGHNILVVIETREDSPSRWGNQYGFLYIDYVRLTVEAAEDPIPLDDPELDDPLARAATTELSWLNPDTIDQCDVWFGDITGSDANLVNYQDGRLGATPYVISTPTPPATGREVVNILSDLGVTLVKDHDYAWAVDCYRGTGLAEPNLPAVFVWKFTVTDAPLFEVHPADQLVDLNGAAVLSASFTSADPAQVTWFKEAGETDIEVTASDPDVTITPNYSGVNYETTLSIANVDVSREGQYYCQANNGVVVNSNPATLGVKHLMAHWTMNQADYIGNQYLDISTEDLTADNADPNNPAGVTFAAGPYSLGATSAAPINDSSFGVVSEPNFSPTQYTDQITISAWIRLTGELTANDGHGILTKGNGAVGVFDDNIRWAFYARTRPQGEETLPSVRLTSWAGGDAWADANSIPVNEWTHVAASVTADGVGAVYVNGVQSGYTDSDFVFGGTLADPVRIGRYGAAGLNFPGEIDDVRVYNYGMDEHGIALLYNVVSGKNVCIDTYADVYDTDGNCKIDIIDFAEFAGAWLSCGLYPACP